MSLASSEIAAVLAELAPVAGSRVDGVRVHAERTVTIELFGRAGATTLLVSAEPGLSRLHAVRRRPPAPPAPFPFQSILRRELEGTTLASITAASGDRVVDLAFERAGGSVHLVAELTGRHGNLFLLGADGAIVASAARAPSQRRDLVPGRPWVAPEGRPEPGTARRFDLGDATAAFPISFTIEEHYAKVEEERRVAEERRRLREPVRAAIARSRRALDKLAEEAARVPAAEDDRRRADLLKQNLHAIRRGAREAKVIEWTEEGPREVLLRLEPALGPRENMERYYRRYRRIVESAARVASRTAEVRARLEELLALLDATDAADMDALPRLEREARRLGAGPRPAPARRSRRDEPLPPYRAYRSLTGAALLVGRNAEGNDALTTTVARGNDLWLHARGQGGAHVVARLEKGKSPDGDTLLDAAHLASHFSEARGEPQVEVVATRAKYVRKVKGAPPGAVTYTQERTLLLRVEPKRLERILATEEA